MRKRSKRSRRGRRSRRPFSKNRNIDAAFPAPASHFLLLLFMQYPRSRRLLSIEIGIRLSSHLVARHGHADPGVRERSHARGGAEAVNRCCWCCSCCCCCRCRGCGAARRAGRRERRREPACQRREARAGGHEEEKRKRKRKRRKEERETSESGVIFFRFFVPRCRLLKRHHFFFSFSLLHRFPCFPLCFSNEGGRLSPFSPWSRDANTRRGDDKRCAVHRERESVMVVAGGVARAAAMTTTTTNSTFSSSSSKSMAAAKRGPRPGVAWPLLPYPTLRARVSVPAATVCAQLGCVRSAAEPGARSEACCVSEREERKKSIEKENHSFRVGEKCTLFSTSRFLLLPRSCLLLYSIG